MGTRRRRRAATKEHRASMRWLLVVRLDSFIIPQTHPRLLVIKAAMKKLVKAAQAAAWQDSKICCSDKAEHA